MKINFDHLRFAITGSASVVLGVAGIVTYLHYVAKFYSWLFTKYPPVVAAVVLALIGFLICVIGSYINMEMKDRRNDP